MMEKATQWRAHTSRSLRG